MFKHLSLARKNSNKKCLSMLSSWADLSKLNHRLDMKTHELNITQIVRSNHLSREHMQVALLIHGAISNSTIYFSNKGQGLAPYLARAGFNVFCVDLRGR